MTTDDIKILKQAMLRLEETKSWEDDVRLQESVIKRFEFTFEMSWKAMKRYLNDQSIETYGVKETILKAAQAGIIDNPSTWTDFLKTRNLSTHTYKQEVADLVYSKAMEFGAEVKKLVDAMEKKIGELERLSGEKYD